MTVTELMDQAKECCGQKRMPRLNVEPGLGKCKTYISDKDHDFQMFIYSICTSISLAYSGLLAARKPNPKRPTFEQNFYDRQTDEQIFAKNLASHIKRDIKYHTSSETCWRKNVLLTPEELTEFILQEYPFLEEFFEPKTNGI